MPCGHGVILMSEPTPFRGNSTPPAPAGHRWPAGACLTGMLGDRVTLGDVDSMFVRLASHRLGHHFCAHVAPPQCICMHSVGVAAGSDHTMVCETVAKKAQIRHDNLENNVRLQQWPCDCVELPVGGGGLLK